MRCGTCTLRILNGLAIARPLDTPSDAASNSFVKSRVQFATRASAPAPIAIPVFLGDGDRDRDTGAKDANDCCVRGLLPAALKLPGDSRKRGLDPEVGEDGHVGRRAAERAALGSAWLRLNLSKSSLGGVRVGLGGRSSNANRGERASAVGASAAAAPIEISKRKKGWI